MIPRLAIIPGAADSHLNSYNQAMTYTVAQAKTSCLNSSNRPKLAPV